MQNTYFRARLAGAIGNLLEHYDSALFGLIAPFIAPLFFAQQDDITALILTYAMLPLGVLTRPLGALFFGWIGDSCSRKQALFLSLLGMSFVTLGMGLLPTYSQIGPMAPILLAIGRMLQSFFAAGEVVGGAIFVLENTDKNSRSMVSSFYDVSTIIGILTASGFVTVLSSMGIVESYWRLLFIGGGCTAFLGLFLRFSSYESVDVQRSGGALKENIWGILRKHRQAVFAIMAVSGFSYITYSLAFTLMNGYIPLVTGLSKADVMQSNTALLLLDLLLLPFFGYLSVALGKEKVMLFGALILAISAIPLFSLLKGASLFTVIFVRTCLIIGGVAFAAPYHAWALEQVDEKNRCLVLSFGYTLGSQLIGAPTSALCLWLYKVTKWHAAPGMYISLAASLAFFIVFRAAFKRNLKMSTN